LKLKRLNILGWICCLLIGIFSVSGCADENAPPMETITSGSITISVDESFKPVIDSQKQVFESLYPDAHINILYKPEAECLKDLNNDSIRMVIVTRGLTRDEEKRLDAKLSYVPTYGLLAFDAIAVITNKSTKDSLFTMQDIRSMANGTSGYKYKMLLDGTSATSTVRFVVDSLLKGDSISSNIVAAKNTKALIDYVSANNDAVGLLGVSWLGNRNDPQTISFLEKVNIDAIECRDCNGTYVKPYQANIANGRYPMVRPLYYILKENYKGVGSGFTNFLVLEKGQLIFKTAYLLPARMGFSIRPMEISQ
jgi:phosphate transport system substrate-binding protein